MKKQHINDFIEFQDDRFTKRVLFKEDKTTVFLLNFKQGQTLPAHKHPGSNVQILVLQGEGMFTVDGKEVPAKENDAFFFDGDEEMAFANTGQDNVSLYVMLNRIPSDEYAKNI